MNSRRRLPIPLPSLRSLIRHCLPTAETCRFLLPLAADSDPVVSVVPSRQKTQDVAAGTKPANVDTEPIETGEFQEANHVQKNSAVDAESIADKTTADTETVETGSESLAFLYLKSIPPRRLPPPPNRPKLYQPKRRKRSSISGIL